MQYIQLDTNAMHVEEINKKCNFSIKRTLRLPQNWAKVKCEWPPPRTRCAINLRLEMKNKAMLVFLVLLLFLVRYTQGQGPGPHAPGLTMRSREADMRVQFEIEEGQPPGTVVGTIPTKPNFTYRFNEKPPEFLLNATSGVITTAMEIDREALANQRFDLVILSSQPTYPLEVRIVILDMNDNSPYFPEPSIEVSFSESANIGTRVILDTATDRDVGINDVNTDYKIVSGNDDGKFRLVVTTNPSGETPYLHLETTGRLDREIKSFYQLNISAQDGGNPPRFGYLLVNITVLDVNDNPPLFDNSDYSVSLNESVPPGTSVLQVRGTDNDIDDNAKITYFLSDTESQFTIDPQTGVISTLEVLKCQQNCPTQGKCPKSCVFTVFARDHGTPRQDGRAYVTVNLLDANDHDPSIRFRFFPSTASYATVDENAQNGSVVAAVSVIDLDEGPNGETWVDIQGGNELGHFRLESTPSFDIVRVNGILDREQIGKYNLTITATDRGIPPRSSTAFLIIHVNDVNDHEPLFEKNEYSAVLGEMVPIGTYVAGISATDEDTGVNSDIYYAIVSGNDRRWFDIDVHTGLITTSHALNREDQDYVELKISARDGGPNPRWTYTYLRIQILDENDEAPAFAEAFMNVTLIESAPPNSLVAVVTAVDNDLGTNGSVEYSLHPDVERLYPKKFFLDSTYGRLTLREQLDREEQEIYTVLIIGKDQGIPSLSSTVTVRIILMDVNDNKPCIYPKSYFYTIRPTDTAGTVVARLTATDADTGKNAEFLFSLVSGSEGKFEIDEMTGIVKTKMHFSKREMIKYEIIVSVRNPDDIKMSDEAVIYVYVGDNQHRTIQFDHSKGYSFVLEEDMKNSEPNLGREAGRVSVSRSVRSGIKYSIVDGDPKEWFQIEESLGIISTSRSIDREVQSKFTLTIVAYDFLGFTQTIVNITVTDLNDFSPTFEHPKGPIGVKEDWPVGHEVYLVKAYDMDVGHNGKIEYALSVQPHNTFYVDKNSGMIYLNRPVRFEVGSQYDVTVTARDLGVPSLYSKLDLVIVIEDVNDRTPVFDHVSYETSLLESVPVNDRFFLLRATDADYGVNKQLTYAITVGNDENRFGVFPDGYLYVKRPLDREKRDFYSLTVTAQDNGEVPRSSSVNIVIHIIDENDNNPTFDNKTFQFFIAENEPPDTYVGRLSAEDLDKGRNAELTYMITNTQSDFMINPKTGFIRTLRYFDREQLVEASGHDYLVMDAVVMDGSITRLRDEAKITVHITDVNDNAPQFIRLPYHAAISEGSPTGTQVIRIAAVDADDGINGNIQYSIVHGNNGAVFQIDDITGQITVSKPLDREIIARYILTVMARDMGEEISHNTTALVRVDILDENDNTPKFDNSTTRMINISEDASVGSRIFTFSATDSDLGVNAEVTFLVASGNFKETFRIDGPSGALFLARPLDYEDKNSYVLNVSASDGGTPRLASTLQVVVKVLDVNDNAPRFSSTAVVRQIEESIPPNTPVVTLTAQDRDSGVNGKILFNISHQEPPGNHFAMQAETGVLYTTKVIDREYSDTFRLTVVATDQAEHPAMRLSVEKTVIIIVEDINDNVPTFVSMDAGVLPGGMEKGYKIMTLSASDPDANNNGMVTYELEGGDSALFTLDKLTGDLYTARAIDRPSVTYTLTVKATDQAVVSVRKSSRNKVTIIGTLRNSEGPVFGSAEYTGSVLENKPVGTSVLSVRAQYPHGQSEKQVEYFLTAVTNAAGSPQSRVFAINRFSGVISTASILDREGGARMFYLDVYAVHTAAQSPKTSKAKVTITVTDSNDSPPVFDANPYKVSLSENAIAGHTVITVSASDPDTEGSLTYILVDEKQGDKFRLDPLTGALYLSQPLDRETQDIHKVRIRADDGVQYSETMLIIEVTDSNDNSPVFEKKIYSFDIPEGTQRGAQAGFVSATDADVGVNKQISYLILSDWGNDVFSLNPQSGVFTLTSHLDYEQIQHYIFVVQAQDSGNPSLSSTITVYFNVVDLNDNAPLFDPMSYSDEVFENITVGTSILRVSATDMDSGDNGCIIYNIIDGNADNRFAIDTDGTIFTSKGLDRETQSFYSLTVSATDRALPVEKRLSSTVQVSVILIDVNDMAPEFVTPNETSVLENVPSNTVVMAIKAIDKDEGRNSYIEYSLSTQNSKFSLGPIDGLLRATGPLDREQKSEYKVTVIAKDRGHPPQSTMAEITIYIMDENDNNPAFMHRQYSATVSENINVGLSVLQVFASDVDEGLNGQVRYSIIAGDLNHDFVMDQDTGIIRVSKNLDYERKSHYALTIQAEDSGVDIRHDTASVTIAVTDVNDNPPTFHDTPYIVHVMENAQSLPVSLMLVTAYDSDQIANNQLQYLIKDGNRSVFSINANTGELSVQKTLDREQQAEYSMTVICIDSGSPRQTGTGSIRIIVGDINDNQPQFAFKEYSTSIMENLPPLSPVITITASDKDSGRNAQIRYSLVGDHEGRFEVDPDTGTISTSTILDREEREVYNMLLVAQDSGLIVQHKAVTNVTIIVEDENDNKPEFAESSYNVYTPDNAVGGHFVFGAVAVDLDSGLNSRLVYHLSGTDADKFQINQDTGVVKLVQKLVNKSEGYELEIHATDSGQTALSSTTTVNVYTHRHQLFPRFHPGLRSFKFAESSENLLVTRVTATSPKVNEAGKLMYYIAGGNSGNAFSVNSEMGEVRLIGGLNRETISSYELWVEARDSDTPSLSSAVKLEILVTDVNDNAPVFEKSIYNATVKEELEPPLFVLHVQAFDVDYGVNGNVEYRLDTEDDTDLPFSLDSKTGKIYTTEILDRETKDQYRIIIKAVDHGTPQRTSSATVYIKVLDKNDNPPRFTRLFSANVTENAAIGTFIIQVTSSDKDINMNANATYSFTENPGGKFHIDPVSGNVTVAGWLDREVKDEYLLKVAAVDGSWQAETPLTVLIQDINDNVPEFSLPEYTFNIPELMQGVSFIGQVSATDRDKKGPDSFVSYSLKRPSDLFRIDPNSGNILSKQVLYYKRTLKGSSPENKHVIQIVATDHGNPPLSSEVTVLINVIDSNNNAPTFQNDFYFSPIPESEAIGLSVLQVIAEDKEDVGINAEIEYQKIGGNGSDYFSIHKKTGWVTISNPLIGLKEDWFAINIKAADKGVPAKSSEVVAMFAITDENHFAPAFTALSYQVVIPENEPLLSEIVTVTATDEDKSFNGEIMYSILSGNQEGQFKISPHTGAITIAKHLDFESVTTYHLNILASDRGFRSKNSTAVLTVLVTDVNDNPPTFNSTKFNVYIAENEPPGSFVTQLLAHDADSVRNSIIEYSIMDGDDHSFFEINVKSGIITSKVAFDYEQKTKYTVQIIASNVGTLLFTSTIVDIHIIGKNEFYPHFIQPVFQFTVSESAGVGTTVGQLQAIDDDSGIDGEVYFLLVGSSNNKGFQIDTKTGSIKVSRILDRESQSRVVLTVLAKNAGSIRGNDTDEAQIVISIQDGNDPPVFSNEIYEARVSEAAPLGTSVVSVSAVDKDVHPNNNQFSFSILSGNTNKAFSIDPQSGAIYTAGTLDRETYDVYNLTVTATDSGNPPQSGSTQVKIYIDDVNDNGPIFETPKVVGYVLENELPYTSVMVLSVTDRDLPPNGAPFKFFLVGGEHKDYFEVEANTGLVKTTKSLNREAIPELELIVEIQDSGRPPIKSQHPVTIMVLDKNDSPSTPRPLTILVWIHNRNFHGGKIADVHPQDLDTVGHYQCQIIEGNTVVFRIPKKCDLHTSKLQNPSNYTLTVSGNDGKHHNVSSTIRVKFLNFDNATLQNSVSLRIWNYSADAFLSIHFDHFQQTLEDILKSVGTPIIYSIVNVEEHLEITLASKASDNSYVSIEDILTLLSDRVSFIRESLQDKDLVIGFNPCEISPCQNKGMCSSFLEMKKDILSIVDSPSFIFTSPFVARQFSCQCPRGFSGPICQYQQDPCLPNPCLSGGTCNQDGITFRCTCTPQFQGEKCDTPRKESCSSAPCKNGGTCQEAPNGGFFCLCRPGFKGLVCEQTADACRPNRCLNGGTCVSENLGYHCVCTSSYFGRHCEKSSYGFHPYSYMAFNPLQPTTNDISIVFSTNNHNALLVYNYGAQSGGRSDFLALEIINSTPTLSFGGSRTAITRISANIIVSDGKWHKVTVIRNGKVASVSVVNCNENGDTCEECLLGNATCSKSSTGHTGTLNFNNNLLYVGGVPTVDPLLERPGQVSSNDFVGCLRGLSVNGRQIDMSAALKSAYVSSTCSRKEGACTVSTCGEGATCIDNWFTTSCQCNFEMLASSCTEAQRPYSIGSGTFIELIPQEKHRRMLLLTDRIKDAAPKTISFILRTLSQNGIVMYSGTDDERTLLQLIKGKLVYSSKVKSIDQVIEELELPKLNDGQWHTIRLSYHSGKYPQVNISVDNSWQPINSKEVQHDFLDPYISSVTVGGQWEHLTGDGQFHDISGCIKLISVNNEVQLQNSTGYFNLYIHGNSHSLCQSEAIGIDNAATDPLSIGVILVIVFFIILLVVILISFLVFRRRKLKSKSSVVKENGNAFLTTSDPHRGHCAGYTETVPEKDVVPKKIKDRDSHAQSPQRPDIIEREIHTNAGGRAELRMEDATPHNEKTENSFAIERENDVELPEHYDLENASSIAPSDIDIVGIVNHYKGFRDGNIHKYKATNKVPKVPSYHKHNHKHSTHQFEAVRESTRNILKPHNPLSERESPFKLQNNTPLARLSPSSELSEKPRILTLEDISGKPLKRALFATAQATSKQFQDPMTNSDRSLNSPVSNLSHSTSSMQSGPQNVNKLKPRDNSMTLGLTTEEIERLNARPRNLSLVSTLDAVSSSSDDNAEKHKLAELLESNTELLEAQDSSTDESGNDSFTCSEFEYDNYDKVHREFRPRNMIFSKLAEEDNENDEDYAKNYDRFDSFRGSFSTLVASDDESSNPPPYKPTNSSMLGWDCLLNWGPNFENLVGVFKDIEQLPDSVNSSGPGHSQTDEDYV